MHMAFLKAFLVDNMQHDSIKDPTPSFSILTVNSMLVNAYFKCKAQNHKHFL